MRNGYEKLTMIILMSNMLKLKKKNKKRMMRMRKMMMLMNPWQMHHRMIMNNILWVLRKG